MYQLFVDYFGDLKLKKLRRDRGHIVYACNVSSGLSENRMIYVIVPVRLGRNDTANLSELEWVSFQTRISNEIWDVPKNTVMPSRQAKEALTILFDSIDRNSDQTIYVCPTHPLKMTLIHDPRKKNYLQYPDKVRLYQALETYRCVLERV